MQSTQELTEALMQALDFTSDELNLNRNGRLSQRQRQKLRQRSWGNATTLAELLDTLFIRKPMWWSVALLRRLLKRETNVVEGYIRIEDNGYSLSVGKHTFYVSAAIVKSFEDGGYYRLYFEAHPTIYMPRLLSGEALPKE